MSLPLLYQKDQQFGLTFLLMTFLVLEIPKKRYSTLELE